MSQQSENGASPRRYKWRYGPLRLIAPWVAVAVGVFLAIRGATGGMDPVFVILGPVLVVLGIAAFFVYRWMAKRGI